MDLSSLKTSYVILREIGRGGMGVVFQAWDRRLERNVALKILSLDEIAGSAGSGSPPAPAVELFLQEAKAIARLNHPNIVTLYDIGGSKGRYYLVMEYVEGYNLEMMQKQHKRVPADLVINIGMQLCEALEYAHRQGIVHRDIKPANVLLNAEGGIKLMDFGIARIQCESDSRSPDGPMLGSVLYMAPEQLVDAGSVDQRADIYSLGVTLYELICGRRPFNNQQIPELIREIMLAPVPSLESCGALVSPELEAVLVKALSKDPAERFLSACDMRCALEAARGSAGRIAPRRAAPEPAALTRGQNHPSGDELEAYVRSLLETAGALR